MSKVAHYLQEHLSGEVMISPDARRYFATDGSILTVTPSVIVYPRGESDVRKAARFTWQLAERGRVVPMTARGAGTDQGGAAIGSGIILAFTAHMHRILELDDKSGVVVVEPGVNYGKLQQTLQTHDRFLPPYPASFEYSTIGGAVANNASGEKSIKYGPTRNYVRSLRVVLANGEVIETSRLKKADLNKKLGLATFEGEVYRAVDALCEESQELLDKVRLGVTKNAAGYALSEVKRADGSLDLTPLFVGAQGTLGIITEVALETEAYNPNTTLLVAQFDDLEKLQATILELRALPELPSAMEMVDEQLLTLVDKINPNQLKDLVSKPLPKAILLVEYDAANDRAQKKQVKKAGKILDKYAVRVVVEADPFKQEELWKIRHASATLLAHSDNNTKALPIIEDGVVPPERFREYLEGVYQLFARHHLQPAIWGHAGDGNLHLQPFLDIAQVGDRQKAFRLMDEYYSLVISLGGSTSGEHGDGRLRAPYLEKLYGPELYAVFAKLKQVFDPYGTLNPGVKMNASLESLKPLLRTTYTLHHLYDHMPRS
ncbi:MAG TPA: FAD-binding oxidoreductase [Candidatus Saccharimonadales bacterium]|nr:FAD-binding oxidoreductase [Candidatus Saccharimonadales bacterium]